MFIGRDHLRGELAAYPVRYLGHDHMMAKRGRAERRRAAAHPAADDENITSHSKTNFVIFHAVALPDFDGESDSSIFQIVGNSGAIDRDNGLSRKKRFRWND